MSVVVAEIGNKFRVIDDGYTYADYDSYEEAQAVAAGLKQSEKISEFIQDELMDLEQELCDHFNITREVAHKKIREEL